MKHLDAKQRGTLHHAINHQLIERLALKQKQRSLKINPTPTTSIPLKGFVRFTDSN